MTAIFFSHRLEREKNEKIDSALVYICEADWNKMVVIYIFIYDTQRPMIECYLQLS